VLAVAIATAVGFLAGVSALRVRGVSLAVVTLAAAIAIEQFVFANPSWGANAVGAAGFGGGSTENAIPEPTIFGVDVGTAAGLRAIGGGLVSPALGLLLLAAALGVGVLVIRLRQSGFGNRMLAVRSNENAAAAAGVGVRATKSSAYLLSSCITGIGGVAYAYAFTRVHLDTFGIVVGLQFVAYAYIGGITLIPGAIFTGLMIPNGLIPFVLHGELGLSPTWMLLVAGVVLILCLQLFPAGVAGTARRAWRGRTSRDEPSPGAAEPVTA
jgi:branched-chain amino acid transport system permease protein